MNVLIITSSYPAYPEDPSGTAGLFVRAFALELARQGHRVVVQPVARKKHYSADDGLLVEPLVWSGGDQELASLNLLSPINWRKILHFFIKARTRVIETHSKYKIDRTLCMWAVPSGLLGYLMKMSLHKPYDVWALGSDIWKIGKIPLLGHSLLSKIVGQADQVFADGIGLCRQVEEISGRQCEFLPSSRVLPQLGRVNKAYGDAEYLNLLFMGRYHHNKGPDILLQAFKRLPQHLKKKLRLKMYGFGPLKQSLNNFIAEHHLNDCVAINDGIGAQELAEELSLATYLVIPSRKESIPVIFSDALQMGTPVIATPAGDLQYLIQEYGCGVLADDFSPQALAAAIETACTGCWESDLSEKLVQLGKKFSVGDTAARWLALQ